MILLTDREAALWQGGLAHCRQRKRCSGYHRGARKVDKNQPQIVAELRQAGCSVTDLHTVGGGCPDIVVGYAGHSWLFEIKSDGGKLTEDEADWALKWRGQYAVIHTTEDALRVMGVIG